MRISPSVLAEREQGCISMLVELASFLKPSAKRSLQQHGILSLGDVLEATPINLSTICQISLDDAVALREQARCAVSSGVGATPAGALSFLNLEELLREDAELDTLRIATFSRSLDTILGGGIPCGQLVEVCGAPGTGKTQLCMQLAVAVQLPVAFGGLDGEALFIDCEGSLVPGRLREIAAAACAQVHQIANSQYPVASASEQSVALMRHTVSNFTVDRVLNGTHYIRVLDLVEFVSLLLSLPELLQQEEYKLVKLVVIDSMAFHFRFGEAVTDFSQRSRMLFSLGQGLERNVAAAHKIAVVATNHVTQRHVHDGPASTGKGEARPSELIPALGDAWSHVVSTRLLLRHPGMQHTILEDGVSQLRHVALLKSPAMPRAECTVRLCPKGIRNAPGTAEGKRQRED